MERLLKDAKAITGINYDISSFADVTEAIHVIQTEMGITGTTALEASETISGSANAMKAAWSNFLVGMADENADLDKLTDNLVTSVVTFGNNLIPRIKKMAPRLIKGLTDIAGTIGRELPGLIADMLPFLIDGGIQLVKSLAGAIINSGPMLKQAGIEIAKALYKGITGKDMSEDMVTKLTDTFDRITSTIGKIVKGIADFGAQVWDVAAPALVFIGDVALKAFEWIGDNINWLLPVLGSLLGALLAFKAVRKVTGVVSSFMSVFSKGGGKGTETVLGDAGAGGGGFLKSFAKLKPTAILKGMGNLAIIIGGMTLLGAAFAKAAPYIAEMSDIKSLGEVLGIVAALGLVGTGLSELAGIVGKIPIATVTKGLANMAIIIGGLTVLTVLIGLVTKLNFDYASMLKLVGFIGALGLVGSALTLFAGIVGAIPIPVVLTGLANIALVLGGFTAIVAAFAALNMIEGFSDFLASGGSVLVQLAGIVGEMAGTLVGKFGEGVTESLPTIGTNLSDFATNIKPMFDTFATVDTSALSEFATAFGALMLVLAGEKILSVITGGIDYAGLGTNLNSMMTNLGDFFTNVQDIPAEGFAQATALFDCLAGLKGLPKEGGVVSWFMGDISYESMAAGLGQLSSEDVLGFFDKVVGIDQTALDSASALFECLAGVKDLPKSGGVFQWFTGDIAYDKLVDGLSELSSEEFVSALNTIKDLPASGLENLTALFNAIAGISDLPKEGGIFQWFTGEINFDLFTTELPNLASAIVGFYDETASIADFTKLTGLFDALQYIGKMTTNDGVDGWNISQANFAVLAENLYAFAANMEDFFTNLDKMDTAKLESFMTALSSLGSESLVSSVAAIETPLSGLAKAIETINLTLAAFPETVTTPFADSVTSVTTSLTEMNTSVSDGMTAMAETLTTGLADTNTALSAGIATIVTTLDETDLYSSGTAIIDGLYRGMRDGMGKVLTMAQMIATSIKNTINTALQINSPSKVTTETGMYVAEGLPIGMRKMLPEINKASTELASASVPYYGDYTPESSMSTYNYDGDSEVNNISPSFTINISGTQDDRAMARKVKRFVAEAIQDVFDSMERKNPVLREV